MLDIKFTDINVRAVNVPLRKPIIAHLGSFDKWPFICVDIYTNSKIIGRSYIGPYLVDQLISIKYCIEALAKNYLGKKIRPHDFYEEGFRKLSLLGYQGISLYSLSALDIAFWDAYSKAADLPLALLLGGELKQIRTYNSRGLWLIPLKQIDKEINELTNDGKFNAVKIRIGRDTLEEDLEAINLAKKATKNNVILMSDFNQCYNYDSALKRMLELDNQNLYWYEEPINYKEYENCAELSAKINTPITIGENFHGIHDLVEAINKKATKYIMPDLMRIGGISGWLKAAQIAQAYNLKFSTHLFPEVSAHLMCVTPTAHWLEWVDWASPILLDTGFNINNSYINIPNIPGTGIEWNEKNLNKYLINI